MSEAVQLALINNLPQILTAFGVIFGLFLTWRVKKNTDGMTTKMVESGKKEGEAEGKAKEQANPTSVSAPLAESDHDRRRGQ